MKILLKILVAPFALVLSLLAALPVFLFDICAFLLTIASVILAVLGVALFFTPTPIGGIVFLFLAFQYNRVILILCTGRKGDILPVYSFKNLYYLRVESAFSLLFLF